MSDPLSFVPGAKTVLDGPLDVGTEQRWTVQMEDERQAVVGQLAPDLARDVSIRRRYVRDMERLFGLGVASVAPLLQMGPQPDPRAPDALPPWRVRIDPPGETLEHRLRRAPLPLDEFSLVFCAVADAVHAVHRAGAVIRDLQPSQILLTQDGRALLVDIGLARVDVLSSHTASSLMLQGSTYAAPEQLLETAIDQRSDLYSVGVMMWTALTGELPFGDGPALLRDRPRLPGLTTVRTELPAGVSDLVHRCIAETAAERPDSAAEIAWVLRGGQGSLAVRESTVCQHCGAQLRVGQRLCLTCGRVGICFEHVTDAQPAYGLDLVELSEDSDKLHWLQEFLENVSQPPFHRPEFIIGSVHMYAPDERQGKLRMPARLYGNLTRATAGALVARMTEQGLRARVVDPTAARNAGLAVPAHMAVTAALSVALHFAGVNPLWAILPALPVLIWLLVRWTNRVSDQKTLPKFSLRAAPAALPASDPLVARLAALLHERVSGDVREIVGGLALLVQRMVDHRASFISDPAEIDLLAQPLGPLVTAVEEHVRQLEHLRGQLDELDEGEMVRALAASEARGDPLERREPILAGLDRLRSLEDQRAAVFHRLLEFKTLLTRTVDMGLTVADPAREHDRQLTMAMAMLESA